MTRCRGPGAGKILFFDLREGLIFELYSWDVCTFLCRSNPNLKVSKVRSNSLFTHTGKYLLYF